MSVIYTYQEPHPQINIFNYCDLSFAMLSALAKFVNVKFTQNIIALQYYALHPYLYLCKKCIVNLYKSYLAFLIDAEGI